ncbi:hypothetical protein DPSP01_003683 [Paraphaeosphaeria sporulosa]
MLVCRILVAHLPWLVLRWIRGIPHTLLPDPFYRRFKSFHTSTSAAAPLHQPGLYLSLVLRNGTLAAQLGASRPLSNVENSTVTRRAHTQGSTAKSVPKHTLIARTFSNTYKHGIAVYGTHATSKAAPTRRRKKPTS